MPIIHPLYELATRSAPWVLRAAAPLNGKLPRVLEARREAVPVLDAWARTARDASRPLLWLHAPSVGESLMAQAIIAELRALEPRAQIAFTYLSPSAARIADDVGADVYAALPWDRRDTMRAVLGMLRPAAVAFVRSEIWPGLVRAAAELEMPTLLVNAVLPSTSSRLRMPARQFLRSSYSSLAAVGAVSREHAERFGALDVQRGRVRVTGDARFDQVWRRIRQPAPAGLMRALPAGSGRLLVAGSTWPADEAVLVDALRRIPQWRAIIAPHEPDGHCTGLERALDRAGITHTRLGAVEAGQGSGDARVIVVDRVGVLADLYRAGDAAYVGGGFHAAGLHSVVEPAALGVPVIFGPAHGNAREAAELARAGGGAEVADAAAMQSRLTEWESPAAREAAGSAAAAYVKSQLGGARRNAELVLNTIDEAEARRAAQ